MIFSSSNRAIAYSNEAAKPVFKVTYNDGLGETEEYWAEDKDAEDGVFAKALANFVGEELASGNFKSLERL